MSTPQAQLFEDELPLIRSCPALNEIRSAEQLEDLTIEVRDGDRLHAHILVLAARIPSVRAAVIGSPKESTAVLRWPTVPLSLATSLIKYVYTGQLEVTQANARGLIKLARMLKLPVVENWGTKYLIHTVNYENLTTIWDFAKLLNNDALMEACLRRMAAQFESFIYSEMFVRLPASAVLALLQSDRLAVNSEEEVVAAISRWATSCKGLESEKRELDVPQLLKEVQWQQTSAQFRRRLLDYNPVFRMSSDCALMTQIEVWLGTSAGASPPCPFKQRIRPSQELLVFGINKNQKGCEVLRFNPHLHKEELVSSAEARRFACYSVVDGSIFVIGGHTPQQAGSTAVDEFIVRERCWCQRPSLANRRLVAASAVVKVNDEHREGEQKALIGVFGGSYKAGASWSYLAACEVFDVKQNKWHKLPDLRKKRAGLTAASIPGDNRIFLFGGEDDVAKCTTVEFCYLRADWKETVGTVSSAGFWMPAASMRIARSGVAATHFRGGILVAGGWAGEGSMNVVEMFSPPEPDKCPLGQWTALAAMPRPHAYFTLINSSDRVFAIGNGKDPENAIEIFTAPEDCVALGKDISSWIWSSRSPVKTLKAIDGAASIRI